jgi:peptidoglycan/LPS O-acetylase OafA/YrhL
VRVRAFGTFDFRIIEPKTFLKEVAGSDQNFRLDEFADTMRSRIVSVFSDALATAKVLNELKLGRFSPWTFWMMRMRRIYPALAVLTIASVIAGWFVTLPAEYSKHLLQALSALTFLSNFAFKSDSGYFAMAAQTKPLLHTWSLSLEWQFYFFMPLIVGLVWRRALRAMSGIDAVVVALQVFAALSLAWCLWASQQDATGSSFFSLQARAWEPLAGGLIAAAEIRRRSEAIAASSWLQSPIVAVAGWLLVAGCVVYPLPEARWPGVLTILPVLGSAIIIAARQGSREGGLLGVPAIQRVGDWSYSIYLWHWPVWVFALVMLWGFAVVVVNGQVVLEGGAMTAARPGAVLYGQGHR